jgi:protein involved in polysaccharide export with SLBB domain
VKIRGALATLLALLTALEPTMVLAQASAPPPSPPPTEPLLAPPTEGRVVLEGAVDARTYILGPGDRLLVELWGLRDLSQEIEVNAEGRLLVPHVGVFGAGGEKLATLRETISERLRSVYPNLHANVTLARPRTFSVNIVGAVGRPGSYPATALMRVSALVPRAVPLPNASTRRVEIRRKGRAEKLVADIVYFAVHGDPASDPTLLDGDTIYVPLRELEVQVSGAVKRPGRYELVRERNVRELLELAGGLTTDASTTLPLRLTTRESGDRLVVHSLSQSNAAQTVLHPGDSVHVPALGDLRRTVVIEGAIVGIPSQPTSGAQLEPERRPASDDRPLDPLTNPTRDISLVLPFVEGDGVSDLIVKAGGLQPWADGSSAYLLRATATAERGRISVDAVAISSRSATDIPIQPGDTLVIPSRRDSVVVGGAVQRPGVFTYSRNLHPPDYITLAGGPTRSGVAGSALVLKRTGVRKEIGTVGEIEPGDVISVPEAALTSSEWINIILIAASLVVSTTAIVISVRK